MRPAPGAESRQANRRGASAATSELLSLATTPKGRCRKPAQQRVGSAIDPGFHKV